MPLEKSTSPEARGRNIATEIRAGRDPKQAAAIAYGVEREAARDQTALTTQANSGIPAYPGRVLEMNKGGNLPRSIEAATMGKWPGRTLD